MKAKWVSPFDAKGLSTSPPARGTVATMTDDYTEDLTDAPSYVESYSRARKEPRKTGWDRVYRASKYALRWVVGIGIVMGFMVSPKKLT